MGVLSSENPPGTCLWDPSPHWGPFRTHPWPQEPLWGGDIEAGPASLWSDHKRSQGCPQVSLHRGQMEKPEYKKTRGEGRRHGTLLSQNPCAAVILSLGIVIPSKLIPVCFDLVCCLQPKPSRIQGKEACVAQHHVLSTELVSGCTHDTLPRHQVSQAPQGLGWGCDLF